ncbi:precorrin-6y C5,15-methyltransferase (decarboxylating) subunit CbiE [Segnochrobactrum spirostomi]|uniref:precorrin-6y C5,15-methyltransferase (decarboxylating) subunit CbiE n=1 Tax=Segnochrobactrum spirostomi TaxID=2608987 RepID=UPI00406BB7A4
MPDVRAADGPGRWLSVVGLGEDGLDGLSPAARAAIEAAELVFGGSRHLALAAAAIRGAAHPWPTPFDVAAVTAARGRRVAVLASGDPFFHGVGSVIARTIPPTEMQVFPAPSAIALAAARLGWAEQDATALSVHGRPLDLVRPHLQPGRRLIVLTSDRDGPAALAGLMTETGFGPSRLIFLEALGGPHERVRAATAEDFAFTDVADLNVVAIEVAAAAGARIIARAPGLPDDLFEHDGQITKREVRAIALAALGPRRGERLWDIGAGSGSIGLEWMLADPSLTAIAVEPRADRAARIARNASAFGVPGLTIVRGEAPAALDGLAAPDAVFIGGGASRPGVLDAAIAALKVGGRLVVNAVTIETETILADRHARLGGDLVRIDIARAETIGGFRGWTPARPVVQWRWEKP